MKDVRKVRKLQILGKCIEKFKAHGNYIKETGTIIITIVMKLDVLCHALFGRTFQV